MKRYLVAVLTLVAVLAGAVEAQQKPPTAAEKAAEKAAMDDAAKRATEMAEAMARAQQKVAEESRREEEARAQQVIPLDVEVVIARYQGDKKLSSLPYALTVNASRTYNVNQAALTSLRMGGQVPLPAMAPALGPDGKPLLGFSGGGPVQYHDIGTNIDARGRILNDGRFEIWVQVSEDSISIPQGVTKEQPSTTLPVIRSFRTANNVVLRDGQTRQFTAAADRITGEVIRVDVTARVAK